MSKCKAAPKKYLSTSTTFQKDTTMASWTVAELSNVLLDFNSFTQDEQASILELFATSYPLARYIEHRDKRRSALSQMNRIRDLLKSGKQLFPAFIPGESLFASPSALEGFAVVLTAGGEGERLRLSLMKKGYSDAALTDFSKATFAIPGFSSSLGALQVNLVMIASLCREYKIDIPVIITTGPEDSITARIIPEICRTYNNFGIKHLRIIAQEERLFLTNEEKIVLQEVDGKRVPITNPDETGGPIMKLKAPGRDGTPSILDWLTSLGCKKTIIVQATALYHQKLLPSMASALGSHDCLGVGILRQAFPPTDPYGTFVTLKTDKRKATVIIEQDIRNDATRDITDSSGTWYLPFNTGFYAFKNELLQEHDLPDFATPPKELRPDLPRSPKIGYAATDLITLAKDPVVLTIDQSMFAVLKNADDLDTLAKLGREFGLVELCEREVGSSK